MPTKIEWAQETWSPIVGCSHISPGCDHCYAERMANRLAAMSEKQIPGTPKSNYKYFAVTNRQGKWNGTTYLHLPDLEKPLKWKKPRIIFVVSMGDLFHESVPFEWIDRIFDIMTKADQHTYLLLTKRPENMKKFFDNGFLEYSNMHNVWLGVTAENQEMADKRIPVLLQIPAVKRFVSIEPMLGNVSFRWAPWEPVVDAESWYLDGLKRLDWIILGGETGLGARPMFPEWVKSVRDQCQESNTPFFFKAWGGKGKGRKSHLIDGKEWR